MHKHVHAGWNFRCFTRIHKTEVYVSLGCTWNISTVIPGSLAFGQHEETTARRVFERERVRSISLWYSPKRNVIFLTHHLPFSFSRFTSTSHPHGRLSTIPTTHLLAQYTLTSTPEKHHQIHLIFVGIWTSFLRSAYMVPGNLHYFCIMCYTTDSGRPHHGGYWFEKEREREM